MAGPQASPCWIPRQILATAERREKWLGLNGGQAGVDFLGSSGAIQPLVCMEFVSGLLSTQLTCLVLKMALFIPVYFDQGLSLPEVQAILQT
jgi:hypothetical protein